MRNRYVGIDVGERRLFGAVIETDGESASISFSPQTDPSAVFDWCTTSGCQSIAIDAPPAHSKGLARVGNRRVAEERLGIGGCYGTPQLGSPVPPWMAAGMRCHAKVSAAIGETIIDLGGTGTVFEVHTPTASGHFSAFAKTTSAPGVIQMHCCVRRRLAGRLDTFRGSRYYGCFLNGSMSPGLLLYRRDCCPASTGRTLQCVRP
jgi:hypothetical protein